MKEHKLTSERKQFLIKEAHRCLDEISAEIDKILSSKHKKAA
jgi:hypothetical protein